MIVFLHLPKTGGTTFRFILENNFGVSNCHSNQTKTEVFTEKDFHFARRFFPGLKSIAGHNLIDPPRINVPGAFYMTILREPIMRVMSHYQDSVLRGQSKQSFAESLRTRELFSNLQVRLIAGEPNLDKAKFFLEKQCHFMGLTEKFDLSLRIFERLYPVPMDLGYKRKVVAKADDIKKSLLRDPAMMELAREHNKLDVALYAFAVEEIFPKLCEKAGVRPTDEVPSYEKYSKATQRRYLIGRLYNKAFRQVYKWRKG